MRDILFKAKRLDNGEWVEGDLSFHKDGRTFIRFWSVGVCAAYEVNPETVSEYAGLEDKNEKPIFEHDIVRATLIGGNYKGFSWPNQKVVFDRGAFCVEDRSGDTTPLRSYAPGVEIEVLGNIFDNPELLEVTE